MSMQPSVKSNVKSKINLTTIVLDSQFEAVFDSITLLASSHLNAPVALITFVDDDSIWIHSEVGYPDVKVVPNKKKFCGVFPKDKLFFEIVDTDLDKEHAEHVYFIEGIKAKYYAAARIKLPLGEMVGVLCIFDTKKRSLNDSQREFLIGLASIVEKILVTKSFQKRIA